MSAAPIGRHATVCALVPHYGCEAWLAQALESLLEQTRPPDAIVVIDDASPVPPVDVVAPHPGVTMLAADDNGGPYRLIQAVIDRTEFDAYLFQDADDWSAPDRLEVLLAEADRTGAELVGSHEVRVLVDQGDVHPVRYPLDVNAVLAERPAAFPLLHPTSLVARALVARLGGFATGMRFSGDAEFLRRAGHAARVVNADHVGYFRRKRAGSLTTDLRTGLGSPERCRVQEALADRARANAAARARGEAADLRPWRMAAAPTLRRLTGPPLGTLQAAPRPRRRPAFVSGGPLFVMGPPRSSLDLLAWALGQHRSLHALADSRWLAGFAADLAARVTDPSALAPAGVLRAVGPSLAQAAGVPGRRLVAAGTEVARSALDLAELFPDARFVHVVRDAAACVAGLLADPTHAGVFHTVAGAWRAWLHAAQAASEAEAALGSGRVLRVRHADLVGDPDPVVRRILAFAGEDWDPACLRPLLGLERPPPVEVPQAPTTAAALALSRSLDRPQPSQGPDREAAARVARRRAAGTPAAGRPETLVDRVRALVADAVPEGATVAVVSRGDDRLLEVADRTGWHLPQVEGGVYAGHHPASSDDAVEELEALQARGAEYLVVPASGLWWLGFYEGLRRHLDACAELVALHEDSGAVWRLSPPVTGDGFRFAAVGSRSLVGGSP
jgi:hypothetical protein